MSGSVAVTVAKRKGLAMQSVYEARAVIDDCRSQVCGGLAAGLDIWEMAILPMLYNAECWQEISLETTQVLKTTGRHSTNAYLQLDLVAPPLPFIGRQVEQ